MDKNFIFKMVEKAQVFFGAFPPKAAALTALLSLVAITTHLLDYVDLGPYGPWVAGSIFLLTIPGAFRKGREVTHKCAEAVKTSVRKK